MISGLLGSVNRPLFNFCVLRSRGIPSHQGQRRQLTPEMSGQRRSAMPGRVGPLHLLVRPHGSFRMPLGFRRPVLCDLGDQLIPHAARDQPRAISGAVELHTPTAPCRYLQPAGTRSGLGAMRHGAIRIAMSAEISRVQSQARIPQDFGNQLAPLISHHELPPVRRTFEFNRPPAKDLAFEPTGAHHP